MQGEKTKLIVRPQLSFDLINADASITTNGKNSCVSGVSVLNFWEHNFDCVKVDALFAAGCDANVASAFKTGSTNDSNPYNLIGNFKTTDNKVALGRALAIISLDTPDAECDLTIGYAATIMSDACGGWRGGWINCDPRCYFGYGFEGFINPFIFAKSGVGIKCDYKTDKAKCFVGYRNFNKKSAATVNNNEGGFFSSNTPSECELGVEFEGDAKLPLKALLVCSQVNRGVYTSTTDIKDNVVGGGAEQGTYTYAARQSLTNHFVSTEKLTSLTATCASELTPQVNLSCALSCANLQTSGRILKWSAGCVTKQPSLENPGVASAAYGIHIGTPAYLQESAPGVSKDANTPMVCEVNCLFTLCGLNIPLYIDYMNKHENADGTVSESATICGLRPMNFWGFGCGEDNDLRCVSSNILDCVEGGMMQDEDEE